MPSDRSPMFRNIISSFPSNHVRTEARTEVGRGGAIRRARPRLVPHARCAAGPIDAHAHRPPSRVRHVDGRIRPRKEQDQG